jgi:hypothetical protein
MTNHASDSITTRDARFQLPSGAGTDSVHTNSEYCSHSAQQFGGVRGIGIVFSLGEGNLLVCAALEEPDALAFSVTRERFKLAASNGIPLNGGVCAVQSGLILPGAARNLHWMGAHADIHDCGCDRLWHFVG